MRPILRLDRRLGAATRRAAAAIPGASGAARALAALMSPAFRIAVAAMILDRRTRAAGLRALAAGVVAALAARGLRDRLARPRPGRRSEGGFPSRHAAAACAITSAAGRADPRLRAAFVVASGAGLLARVATAEHEPADILAGAALGLATAAALERAARGGSLSRMRAPEPTSEQRARTRAVNATARTVSGVAFILGLLGVLNTGIDGVASDSAETLFVFLVHPITALAWLAIGMTGIAMAVDTVRARRFLVVAGGLLVTWAVLALIAGDGTTQALTRDRQVLALHLIGGGVSLAVALAPLPNILVRALGRPRAEEAATQP